MHTSRNYLPLSIAAFLLIASSMTGSFGCGSSSSPNNNDGGGVGGATGGGTGGSANGAGGSAAGTGGVTGTDAGADVHSGAGGMIVIPDGGSNNFTCADLLACCNSGTGTLRTMCLAQYNMLLPQGNMACGTLLAGIKANNLCP